MTSQSLLVCATGEATQGDLQISVSVIALKDSYLLLISDQASYGIGTVSLSLPPSSLSDTPLTSPFTLFGLKHPILANAIGRAASKILRVPVLSLLLLQNTNAKPEILLRVTMDAVTRALSQVTATSQVKNSPDAGSCAPNPDNTIPPG